MTTATDPADDDLPESPHDPDETLLPETPAGYQPPAEFRYPTAVLFAGAAALVVASYVAFGDLLMRVQGDAVIEALATVTETGDGVAVTVDLAPVFGLFVAAMVVTTVVHEFLHGLVFRRQGYDVSYGVAPFMGAFYAAAFHQYIPRRHAIASALAPLAVITPIGIALLAVPVSLLAVWAFFVLVVNTAGAIGDLYAVYRIWRMPEGSLLYDSDIRHMYAFYPADEA